MSEWLAGANVLGSVLGAFGQGSANAANASMAREAWNNNLYAMMENQRFQERMSSTAYQRAMNDMRYAGLNPILAYSQGGATGATGGGASMTPAIMQNTMDDLGEGVASAAQAAKDWAAKDLVKSQEKQSDSQAELNKATEALAKQNEAVSAAQVKKVEEETENVRLQRPLIGAQTMSAAAAAGASAATARHTNLQADDFSARGDSVLGRVVGSLVRMGNTGAKLATEAVRDAGGHSAKSQSENPSLLPSWLSSSNPVVQERIRRRRAGQ